MIARYGLYRDPARGWIAGVCAGLGERFGVSTGVIRMVIVLLAVAGTPVAAAIVYAVMAVLIPARPLIVDASYRRRWRQEY
jgi:phage shock protein C